MNGRCIEREKTAEQNEGGTSLSSEKGLVGDVEKFLIYCKLSKQVHFFNRTTESNLNTPFGRAL